MFTSSPAQTRGWNYSLLPFILKVLDLGVSKRNLFSDLETPPVIGMFTAVTAPTGPKGKARHSPLYGAHRTNT